jgi:(R,R)-butanediol dehydrogenase / meso-butanediol dehydrogenase / diacetyl reductase
VRAVAIGEDRRLEPTELQERPLEAGEARVAVAFCGICGSDLHLRPSQAIPAGSVMGHEFSGTVTELGSEVERFSIGDRVAVFPFAPCEQCPNCLRGDYHVCLLAASSGLGLGANPGGYAESVVVAGSMLIPIPDELSLEHGALVEPLAVALHGINIGEVKPSDRCVVIGAGPIGVMTALALETRGVDQVLVIERNERRQDRMRSLGVEAIGLDGVHEAIGLDGVHEKVIEIFGGELPDVVLECAGNPAAPPLAIELIRSRGIVVLLGVLEEPVAISQLVLMIKEAQLRSSFAYRFEDFAEAIDLLVDGDLPAESLITTTARLEDAQRMFELLEDPGTAQIKILLDPSAR